MNSFGLDICEICGTQSADHAGWFSVAGEGAAMEVLPWTDTVRGRSDCRHACCGDHVEMLVVSTAAIDLPATSFLTSPRRWHPEALVPPDQFLTVADSNDSLLSILSAVDSILHSPDEEDEAAPSFDA